MKEFIEKLIGRLEEELPLYVGKAKEIVNQLTEECKISIPLTDYDSIIKLIESEIERTESFAEHETQINIMFYVKELKEKYNNDFCEWKKNTTAFVKMPYYCTGCGNKRYGILIEGEYCPCCGKKTKVVE